MNEIIIREAGYPITVTYKDGARYVVRRLASAYILNGVHFATLAAALAAIRRARASK